MITVDSMIDEILRREGGYVDHPNDKGGATNFGITQATLQGYLGHSVSKKDVEDMSESTAREIYKKDYYLKPKIDQLPESIQSFVFDCAVNHGPRRAIKFVQEACNDLGVAGSLDTDGLMGPSTANAASKTNNAHSKEFYETLLSKRRTYYEDIVASNPDQKVFLAGWMNRVDEFDGDIA